MRAACLCLALLTVGAWSCSPSRTETPASTASPPVGRPISPPQPNIVLIVTDDQRWDTLGAMPFVRRHVVDRGVTFSNAVVVDPVCCPSRASILTGGYSHTTGVYSNTPPHGGAEVFDPASTVATWLQAADYRTGLVGKYLNHYRGRDVPPGWGTWRAFSGPFGYSDYDMNIAGSIHRFGSDPEDYSTRVVDDGAIRFLDQTPGDRPFFLYVAPFAPHAPATPDPLDVSRFPHLATFRPPNYNEADLRDKPVWIQRLPVLTTAQQAGIDALRQSQLRSLQAVDRMVASIVRELRRAGRLQDTVIMFTSDNGLAWGEHRWRNKLVPYEESLRVPLVVRWDGVVAPGSSDAHQVANIDLAPTIAEIAGLSPEPVDGRSFAPLLTGKKTWWRRALLFEFLHDRRAEGTKVSPPSYCGLRTRRWTFVHYETGEEELYDRRSDPFELSNGVDRPGNAEVVTRMRRDVRRMCHPLPPGMRWEG